MISVLLGLIISILKNLQKVLYRMRFPNALWYSSSFSLQRTKDISDSKNTLSSGIFCYENNFYLETRAHTSAEMEEKQWAGR